MSEIGETIQPPDQSKLLNLAVRLLGFEEPVELTSFRDSFTTEPDESIFVTYLSQYQEQLQILIDSEPNNIRASNQIAFSLMTAMIRLKRNDMASYIEHINDALMYAEGIGCDESAIFYVVLLQLKRTHEEKSD